MPNRTFKRPVRIQIGRVDRDRIIVGTHDAAKVLLRDWPAMESQKRITAMQACLEVINGGKPPSIARAAFVTAAKDAGVYLGDYDPA